MPYAIPGTQELINRNIANIESALNQHTPPAQRAFNNVIASVLGMTDRELYGYVADIARENLVLTASESGLEMLGNEYNVTRVQQSAWEGIAVFDVPDGNTLYLGTVFIGAHGLKYETMQTVTAPSGEPGGGVFVFVSCTEAGPSGNLSINDMLTIQSPIPGFGRTAKITETVKMGMPIEDIEVYRQRILDMERSERGGGNSSDFRSWAQAVPGVRRAYPFSGPPEGSNRDALPGERTVYVECVKEINPEGITPESLLTLVKKALLADPDTGISREILGLTPDTLYVKSIIRTGIYITIVGLTVQSGAISEAQSALFNSLTLFLESFSRHIQGLDPDFDKMDTITSSIVTREVQNVIDAYGGTAWNVLFGTAPSEYLGKYELKRNEKVKLAGLSFQNTEGPANG